jgi:hypothetical protein
MKNYHVTMDDDHRIDIKAWSASDAIQLALERHLGHRVAACHCGTRSMAFTRYDIPKHEALTEVSRKASVRRKKMETEENRRQREAVAPWVEEWLKKRSNHA